MLGHVLRRFCRCRHGLFRVARMTQALQIPRVSEQRPVALVVPDVVHVGGRSAQPTLCAFPAEGLPQELAGAQLVSPDRQAVPAVPGSGLPPGRLLRAVPGTPAVTGQHGTTWMPAGPQRFTCHGLSPPRSKTKQKAGANDRASLRWSLAPALKALAPVNIHDYLGLAVPAVDPQPLGPGVRLHLDQPLIAAAVRAHEKSILHCQHFTIHNHCRWS